MYEATSSRASIQGATASIGVALALIFRRSLRVSVVATSVKNRRHELIFGFEVPVEGTGA